MSELEELRSSVRAFLGKEPTWERLCGELGLMSLPADDAPLEVVCAVLEETGRVLLPLPYLPSVVAAHLLRAVDPRIESDLAGGSVTAALALDGLDRVAHAEGAGVLLHAVGDELVLTEDFTASPVQLLDQTRPAARVVPERGRVVGSASAARDLLWLALAAESVGAARRLLELTVEHLLTREQFGRPLGSFQALRHRVSDLTVLLEAATSTTWYASQPDTDLTVAAPLAKAAAADAFQAIAGACLQLHGGIGFTWEHPLHRYFKRAWSTALTGDDSRTLRELAFDRAGAHEETDG